MPRRDLVQSTGKRMVRDERNQRVAAPDAPPLRHKTGRVSRLTTDADDVASDVATDGLDGEPPTTMYRSAVARDFRRRLPVLCPQNMQQILEACGMGGLSVVQPLKVYPIRPGTEGEPIPTGTSSAVASSVLTSMTSGSCATKPPSAPGLEGQDGKPSILSPGLVQNFNVDVNSFATESLGLAQEKLKVLETSCITFVNEYEWSENCEDQRYVEPRTNNPPELFFQRVRSELDRVRTRIWALQQKLLFMERAHGQGQTPGHGAASEVTSSESPAALAASKTLMDQLYESCDWLQRAFDLLGDLEDRVLKAEHTFDMDGAFSRSEMEWPQVLRIFEYFMDHLAQYLLGMNELS